MVQDDIRILRTTLASPIADRGPGRPAHGAGAPVSMVSPVLLPDGTLVFFEHPRVVVLLLVEANKHWKLGEALRQKALRSLDPPDPGGTRHRQLRDSSTLMDCFSHLSTAALFTYAALEAFANACIDDLPEHDHLVVGRRGGAEMTVPRHRMARELSLEEKLHLVVPKLTGNPSVKGRAEWRNLVTLRRLRHDLVHIKNVGYSVDPTKPGAYARLLAGVATDCVLGASDLIELMRPGWLTPEIRNDLRERSRRPGPRPK